MKRLSSLLLLIIAASAFALYAAAPTAQQLLRSAADKLSSAKSLTATCVLKSATGITTAHLTMVGNRFTIRGTGIEVWYNGTDQWTYSANTKEVTITTPTPEELSQINPLAVLGRFTKDYTPTLLPSPKGLKKIALRAKKSDEGITDAIVTLAAGSLKPLAMDLTLSSGDNISVSVTALTFGPTIPQSTFTYSPSLHPNAYINDLR